MPGHEPIAIVQNILDSGACFKEVMRVAIYYSLII
jgi:hypothetical protein